MGITRFISSSGETGKDPGRDDSPPMSMICAPCSAMVSARLRASSLFW